MASSSRLDRGVHSARARLRPPTRDDAWLTSGASPNARLRLGGVLASLVRPRVSFAGRVSSVAAFPRLLHRSPPPGRVGRRRFRRARRVRHRAIARAHPRLRRHRAALGRRPRPRRRDRRGAVHAPGGGRDAYAKRERPLPPGPLPPPDARLGVRGLDRAERRDARNARVPGVRGLRADHRGRARRARARQSRRRRLVSGRATHRGGDREKSVSAFARLRAARRRAPRPDESDREPE